MRARNILVIIVIGAAVFAIYWFFFLGQSPAEDQSALNTQTESGQVVTTSAVSSGGDGSAPVKVSIDSTSAAGTSYIETLGTVKAKEQIKILPQTSGQLALVNVKEGDYVKQGEVLFVIGGTNGRQHPAVIATAVAETNLATAQKAYQAAVAGNDAALRASQLQLQSARHALEGTYTDLAVMDRSMYGLEQGYDLSDDSLERTQYKNSKDLEKIEYGISQLKDGINALENKQHDLELLKAETLAQITDPAAKEKSAAEFSAKMAELDKSINDLYGQLDQAKIGYDGAKAALPMAENQIEAALIQTSTQRDTLAMQQYSARQKLGIFDGSSDPVRLAEVGLQATEIKNDLTLAQAKAALELAKMNVELSKVSKEALWVKAPTDGIVADVGVSVGDVVSPQVLLTSIINPKQFELKVGINPQSAEKVIVGSTGQVKIGGRYINVPVSSISPAVDQASRLVTVTMKLPKIIFRPYQTISARVPLTPSGAVNPGSAGDPAQNGGSPVLSVPLDAVIIGTEEQYVFVLENGMARKRSVTLGDINGSLVEVTRGLAPGDRIIVDGAKEINDGQSVQV